MELLKTGVPTGFDHPTALPHNAEEARRWQEINRAWWESHPMRYDWKDPLGTADSERRFFEEIDARFFADAEEYLPRTKVPFDGLIPFDALAQMAVLEIGVGCGSHAGLLARHARSFTGIDLTEYAVNHTSARMRLFGLPGRIVRMDAEKMAFPDNSFDFIWSWGVIHHSANTRAVLGEMRRVLRPGGRAITMVYHRNFWNHYVCSGLLLGVLKGMIWKGRSVHEITQLRTDGGLARFYTVPEWKALTSEFFDVESTRILGSKSHIVPLPAGRLKGAVMRLLPNGLSCLVNNRLGYGAFLVSSLRRTP